MDDHTQDILEMRTTTNTAMIQEGHSLALQECLFPPALQNSMDNDCDIWSEN